MRTLIAVALALLVSAPAAYAQGMIHTFISPSCDTVALLAPIGATRDSVHVLLAELGMSPEPNRIKGETYESKTGNITVVVTYKNERCNAVFLYIRYDIASEAYDAADVINRAIERTHGEADPKTHYYYRRCSGQTYILRASSPRLATGTHLCLAMLAYN